jgi:hypothetical protein
VIEPLTVDVALVVTGMGTVNTAPLRGAVNVTEGLSLTVMLTMDESTMLPIVSYTRVQICLVPTGALFQSKRHSPHASGKYTPLREASTLLVQAIKSVGAKVLPFEGAES